MSRRLMLNIDSPAPVLTRAAWQSTLFGIPDRAALAECVVEWACRRYRIRVHRNHAFEPVSSAIEPYAAWNGLAFEWSIGAYDDTLSFDLRGDGDADLVWVDCSRLRHATSDRMAQWLTARLWTLRSLTANPIVVLAWPLSAEHRESIAGASIPGVYVADLQALAENVGVQWLNPRTESISGTRFSNRACLETARRLACMWLPAAIGPRRKAIAIDLDGTLYRGVLGEDGPDGVELSDGHRLLQESLAKWRAAGLLLGLVSRNDVADVEALFAARTDFPLKLTDFSLIELSWDDKSSAIERIASKLRIGPEAIVFVDDNPGELAEAASALAVFTVHADLDASKTAAALDHVAGLFRWRTSVEDDLRENDLRAAADREARLAIAPSRDEYLRSLDVRLRYYVGRTENLSRIAELAGKTNQFNLALRRMNEAEIARRLSERRCNVVAIDLSDRLSDSGVIAAVVGRREGDRLRVEELCVSCRALGRRLEDSMLTKALLLLAGSEREPPKSVVFDVKRGPRNGPARAWLADYANEPLPDEIECVQMPFGEILDKHISPSVRMEIVS